MTHKDIRIIKLDSSTAKEQVELINKVFNSHQSQEQWLYKHCKNPDTNEYFVYGALYGKMLVGINAFMLMKYYIQNKEVLAMQSCDSAVDPDFRRRGIFERIVKFAEEDFKSKGIAFLFGFPGSMSYPGFIKMGWKDISFYRHCILLCNPGVLIAAKLKSGLLNKLFRNRKVFTKPRRRNYRKIIEKKDVQITIADKCPLTDIEIEHLHNNRDITIIHTMQNLKWRIDDNKEYRYLYYMARYNNELLGLFIVKESLWGKSQNAMANRKTIIEWYFKDYDILSQYAASALIEVMAQKSDIISVWLPKKRIDMNMYLQIGFSTKLFLRQKSPIILKVLSEEQDITRVLNDTLKWDARYIETDIMF